MLIPYDPFRDWDRSGPEPEPLAGDCHYATEVAQMLHCESLDDLSAALDRAMQVCEQAGFAVPVHFRQVFRDNGQALQRDLRLSGLASYLVIINAGTEHQAVVQAQLRSFFRR